VIGPETAATPHALRDHLRAHAHRYDVVEYEHDRLPFPRSDLPPDTLLVARSVLLIHHFLATPIPTATAAEGRGSGTWPARPLATPGG